MQNSSMDGEGPLARDVEIRQVRGEQKIVRGYSGTQQQGPSIPQVQRQFGEVPHPVIEQAFFGQSGRLHIPQPVEHKKHSPVFQDPGPIVSPGRGGRYVVLGVCDSTFIQFKTPSSTVIEADFG